MKLLLKVFILLIIGVAFNTNVSFGVEARLVGNDKEQEFKKVENSRSNAAFLEHSRISFPVHSESLPSSTPSLFTFVLFLSFTSFSSYNRCQKKLKVLRQRWLWLILFPFHTFY